jgi:hypothetical protein
VALRAGDQGGPTGPDLHDGRDPVRGDPVRADAVPGGVRVLSVSDTDPEVLSDTDPEAPADANAEAPADTDPEAQEEIALDQ